MHQIARLVLGILLLVLNAPYVVGLDLIGGELMGVHGGIFHIFDLWLEGMTSIIVLLGGTEILAKIIIGTWCFLAPSVALARYFARE